MNGGEIAHANGKRTWFWHYENHMIPKPDLSPSVSEFEFAPRILVSTFANYAELAAAYELRARPKAVVTPRIQKLADSITQNAKTPRAVVRALYEWVAQNIRYEDNLLGNGLVVPHDTDHILDNKIGDCKDHVVLLQALLSAKHIASTAALINSDTVYHLPNLPVANVFDHVINYVPSLNMYLDSTWAAMPFGMLSQAEEGKPTLHTSDFHGVTYTPPTDNAKNWSRTIAETTYHEDGSADGTIETFSAGEIASRFRRFVYPTSIFSV